MDFLLSSTWLALTVWVGEHGHLLVAAAACVIAPARALVRSAA